MPCIVKIGILLLLGGLPAFSPADRKPRQENSRNAALLQAAEKGDTVAVQTLLKQGTAINARDELGWTPLMEAANNGHSEVVQILLNHGAEVNARDITSDTPLMTAGNASVVRLLLDHGADLSARNDIGRTALMEQARQGSLEIVQALLDRGADINDRDKWGKTALMYVAQEGSTKDAAFLLDHGADIRAVDKQGKTVLTYAVYWPDIDARTGHEQEDHLYMVKLLLDRGADINATGKPGKTTLMFAAYARREKVVNFLLAHGAVAETRDKYGRTALTWAATSPQNPCVPILRKLGLPVGLTEALLLEETANAQAILAKTRTIRGLGPYDDTPVMIAAAQGNADMVRRLLEKGATVHGADIEGQTAVMLAIGGRPRHAYFTGRRDFYPGDRWTARREIVRMLLEKGAEVNGRTCAYREISRQGAGETALMWAVQLEQPEIVRMLLAHGADTRPRSGWPDVDTALSLAIDKGNLDIVRMLLEAGADPNERFGETFEMTPLHYTVWTQHPNLTLIRLLLDRGANVNARRKGTTALMDAAEEGKVEAVQLLVSRGAKVNLRNREGKTALDIAVESKQTKMVDFLRTVGAKS